MSALNTLHFSGFTLRPAMPADLHLAHAWTSADPFHAEAVKPDFWIEQRIGRDSYLLSDERGPVFFFKLERLAEDRVAFHIQFMPSEDAEAHKRTRRGLVEGFVWIERVLLASGVREASFDSRNPQLIQFCKKRLGFTGAAGTLRKALSPAMAAAQ